MEDLAKVSLSSHRSLHLRLQNIPPKLSMPHCVGANNFPEKKPMLCPLKSDFQSKWEIDCKVSYNEVLIRKKSDHGAH